MLSDLHIRNELGIELLRRLRATPGLDRVPFAITTATAVATPPEVADTLVEVLKRPIEPSELLSRVAALTSAAAAS